MNLGSIYKDLGKLDQALASTLKSLELNSNNPGALMNLGSIYKNLGNLDQALAATLKCIELNPNNPGALMNLGSIYKDLGNLNQALASTLKSLELNPDNPTVLMNLGGIYKNLGNLDQALASTLKSLELNPDNPTALMNLGGIYKDLGNLDQALAATLKCIDLNPDNPDAHMNLGGIYKDLGNLDQALAATLKCIELNPNNPDAHINLGGIYKNIGNLDQALASTLKSLELNPDNPSALMNLGSIYKNIGNLDQALVATLKSLELNPDNPEGHMNLGSIYKNTGNLDQALVSTLKSLELNPDNPDAHMNLGGIYNDLGSLDEALASTLKSLELKPDNPDAYMNLGGIYKNRGSLDQALASTLKSLELKPEGSQALCKLGLIKMALGQTKEAKRDLLTSIKCNDQAWESYFALSTMLETTVEAEEVIESMTSSNTSALTANKRVFAEFALSNCFHKIKQYGLASKHLQLANKYKLMAFPSDVDARLRQIALSTSKLQILTTKDIETNVGERRIFIVGMPRSGSTLLETILSMNPVINDLGETRSLELAISSFHGQEKHDSNYRSLNEIYSQMNPINTSNSRYTIDKNLSNFMRINYIACHMPGAKIIHCQRDPMDNILSMYRSNLMAGNNYTANLKDSAKVLIAQEQVMQIQKGRYPEKIFTFNYDQFVNEPEANLRKLLAWIGLEFNARYLHPENSTRSINTASVMQARRPISNKSVGGWRNYENILKPALCLIRESAISSK